MLGLHLVQKLRHDCLDVGDVVQTDSHKVQTLRAIVSIDLDQIRKLFAAGIAPGGPEINQERTRRPSDRAADDFLQTVEIDYTNIAVITEIDYTNIAAVQVQGK